MKDAKDYEILKDVLLKRFNLTEEGFKQKFKFKVLNLELRLVRHLLSLLLGWRII